MNLFILNFRSIQPNPIMPLTWNEIKTRAQTFIKDWEHGEREEADAKEFLIDFLNIFGISRKKVATFEHKVKKLNEADGYIDLLWKGQLLVEMKSRGKDLEKAYKQAKNYCAGLKDYELPSQIVICDFERFDVYDENGTQFSFRITELLHNIQVFGSIAGYEKRVYKEQDSVNIEAAEQMGKLHDKLKATGYEGHELEVYLVRLVFCMFADDTNIFEKNTFLEFIETKTSEDGSDLALRIAQLFQLLNTPNEKRSKNLDERLAVFPYVNGKLFEAILPMPDFDGKMRQTLLDCCALHWGKISPAIFGSLFQSVMDEKARRNLGAHYTSEKNIMKVIKPLFLDELEAKFEKSRNDKRGLQVLHSQISKLKILDPACGCGNFLIISYRELRLLELKLVKQLLQNQQVTSINDYFLVDVDQFYGIEYEDFPSQIAQVAMWLIDHQMNEMASLAFGQYYKRIPLKKSATVIHGNALRLDWQSLLPANEKYNYILGNPPFIGKSFMNTSQKSDMEFMFKGMNGAGVLDYVTAWYIKAGKYMQDFNKPDVIKETSNLTKTAFVSTNSIVQGEQVGILWNELFSKYKIKIHFAHRTFSWRNEARGNAAVHVVIIGFANFDVSGKVVFEYQHIQGEPLAVSVKNINPYLVDAKDILINKLRESICNAPEMNYGSMPNDGGFLLLNQQEKDDLVGKYPNANKFVRPFLMGEELINNIPRYCLWLLNANPTEIKSIPPIFERIEKVRKNRLASTRPKTKELGLTPTLFGEIRQPTVNYIALPRVSSFNRDYIPISILDKNIIAGDKVYTIQSPSFYHFGVILSVMHMTWMRYTSGRLKSDYSYSNSITYNNFPWPENINVKQREAVEKAAQAVLDARAQFPDASLADLYDPNTMPSALVKAHQTLDRAVDLCYRSQHFPNQTNRIEFLFELYDKYTAGMFQSVKKAKKKKEPEAVIIPVIKSYYIISS